MKDKLWEYWNLFESLKSWVLVFLSSALLILIHELMLH